MHEIGWLSAEELGRYFGDGTVLKGLSDAHVPGVETTSGSMGHGLSVGVGLGLGGKEARHEAALFCNCRGWRNE